MKNQLLIEKHIEEMANGAQWLQYLANQYAQIDRIIGLVQNNREFFNATPGHDCLALAADKLEELIKETRQPQELKRSKYYWQNVYQVSKDDEEFIEYSDAYSSFEEAQRNVLISNPEQRYLATLKLKKQNPDLYNKLPAGMKPA